MKEFARKFNICQPQKNIMRHLYISHNVQVHLDVQVAYGPQPMTLTQE